MKDYRKLKKYWRTILKKNAKISRVTLAEGLELNDAPRYRVRTLPAAGAILKADDKAEQLTL